MILYFWHTYIKTMTKILQKPQILYWILYRTRIKSETELLFFPKVIHKILNIILLTNIVLPQKVIRWIWNKKYGKPCLKNWFHILNSSHFFPLHENLHTCKYLFSVSRAVLRTQLFGKLLKSSKTDIFTQHRLLAMAANTFFFKTTTWSNKLLHFLKKDKKSV